MLPPKQECFWSRKTILEQNLDPGSHCGKAPSSSKGSWFWGKVAAEGKCLKWISCHPRWMTAKIAPRWLTADSPSFLLLNLLTSTFIRASRVTWWPHTTSQVALWVFIIGSHAYKHSNCFSINSDEEQPCRYSDYYFCITEACLKFVCRLATWFDPKECAAWQQVLLTFVHLASRCVGSVACRDAEPGSEAPHNVDVFSFNWFDLVLILAFRWVSPLSLNKTSPMLFFPLNILWLNLLFIRQTLELLMSQQKKLSSLCTQLVKCHRQQMFVR